MFDNFQVLLVTIQTVEVFAVDYGYALKAPHANVFTIPAHLSLTSTPRKISLCSLYGRLWC